MFHLTSCQDAHLRAFSFAEAHGSRLFFSVIGPPVGCVFCGNVAPLHTRSRNRFITRRCSPARLRQLGTCRCQVGKSVAEIPNPVAPAAAFESDIKQGCHRKERTMPEGRISIPEGLNPRRGHDGEAIGAMAYDAAVDWGADRVLGEENDGYG